MVPTLDIKKWKESIEGIKKCDNELTTEEHSAFDVLHDHWRNGNFEPEESAELIKQIKSNLPKHGSNRVLQAHLKDFAALCDKYYLKTNERFNEFSEAMRNVGRSVGRTATSHTTTTTTTTTRQQTPPPPPSRPTPQQRPATPQRSSTTSSSQRINFGNGEYFIGKLDEKGNGNGEYHCSNGSWERGTFVNLRLHGQGTCYFPDRKRTDTGQYANGSRIGRGTMKWADGDVYIGEWNDSGPHGQGEYRWANGDWYKGAFVDDRMTGQGTLYEYDIFGGCTSTGEFRDNCRVGSGVMKWANGDVYTGEWNDSGPHGQGKFQWANGEWYKGAFVNNKRTGMGTFYKLYDGIILLKGTTYTGEFSDGYLVGSGVIKWTDGARYEGTWDDTSGYLNGDGWMYYANGSSKHVKWVKGEIITPMTFWEKIYDGIYPALSWVWEYLPFVPYILTAIATVVALFMEGLLSALIVAVGGAISSFLLMYVIYIVEFILEFLWRIKWITLICLVLIFAKRIFALAVAIISSFGNGPVEPYNNIPPTPPYALLGVWNCMPTGTLEFQSVDNGEISAVITFPKSKPKKLSGAIIGDTLHLKVLDNNVYYGEYKGTLDADTTVFEGKYSDAKTGKITNFTFIQFKRTKPSQTPIKQQNKPTTQQQDVVVPAVNFPKTGKWKLTGAETISYTADMVVQSFEKNTFKGYFDWYTQTYMGREYFSGTYNPKTKQITLTGKKLENAQGMSLSAYKASLSDNGNDFINGVWSNVDDGGAITGKWEAIWQKEQ